jgi:hypothetical protein
MNADFSQRTLQLPLTGEDNAVHLAPEGFSDSSGSCRLHGASVDFPSAADGFVGLVHGSSIDLPSRVTIRLNELMNS